MEQQEPPPPFTTTNRQLAFALATCGCKFAGQDQEGPAIQIYSVGFLRSRGIGKGKDVHKAVDEAISRKIVSNTIKYSFVRDHLFERCIKAWDGTVDMMQLHADKGLDAEFNPPVSEEDMMQILCVHANNCKKMADELPWINKPLVTDMTTSARSVPVTDPKSGEQLPGAKEIVTGKGRIWTHRPSQRIVDKLKLPAL